MTTTAWTGEAAERLIHYLDTHRIPSGLGTKESACSLAAINLALTGELTDEIPDCMSEVVGRWVIRVQDAMPDQIRNSPEWKAALVDAAGTGRGHEAERSALILDWMWETPSDVSHVQSKHLREVRLAAAAWTAFDPAGLLARLNLLSQDREETT